MPLGAVRVNDGMVVREIGSARVLTASAFLVAFLMLFGGLGELSLAEPDEGRNAEVAREMWVSGAWLVPTFDGLPYLDKPAFFFRSVALSFSLLGQSEAATRLPSALSGLATLALLFAFCRRCYDETTAALAVIVASTALLPFAFSRLVIMDAMLGSFVCASIFAAFLAEETAGRPRRLWYLASAAAAGFATLVKGPVGFLVPGLVILVFNLVEARHGSRRGALRRCFAPLNVLLFLAVVLPWFLGLCARHPDFFYYGLVEESFHRFTTGSFRRSQPFWFYLPVVFAGLFPWSLLLPESAVVAWRRRAGWSSTDRLFAVWTVVVVIFFSLSQSKLAGYVLTAAVALAALTARVLANALEDPEGRSSRILLRGAAAAAVSLGLLTVALLFASRRPDLFPGGEDESGLAGSFPSLAAGLAFSGAVALAAWLRKTPRLAVAALSLLPLVLLTAGLGTTRAVVESLSARQLSDRIGPLPASAELACLECFPESLPFYQQRAVVIVDRGGSPVALQSNYLLFRWRRHGLKAPVFVDSSRLDAWIGERDRLVFLLGERRVLGRLEALAAARGLAVAELAPGWWGVLIPEKGRR
jgi:4-amino-4-deoxy-L-arabinose transferase-like glycosyltransferase